MINVPTSKPVTIADVGNTIPAAGMVAWVAYAILHTAGV